MCFAHYITKSLCTALFYTSSDPGGIWVPFSQGFLYTMALCFSILYNSSTLYKKDLARSFLRHLHEKMYCLSTSTMKLTMCPAWGYMPSNRFSTSKVSSTVLSNIQCIIKNSSIFHNFLTCTQSNTCLLGTVTKFAC